MATRYLSKLELQTKLLKMRNEIRTLEGDLEEPQLREISEKKLKVLRARYKEFKSVWRMMR